MKTKLMSKTLKAIQKTHGGCASEEPDEGNLQVRFCEGAHSNPGANTSTKGALWALLDRTQRKQQRSMLEPAGFRRDGRRFIVTGNTDDADLADFHGYEIRA